MNWSELFYYDETSPSCLRWAVDVRTGKDDRVLLLAKDAPAGGLDSDGYYRGMAKRKFYKAHRVVWEMFNGELDEGTIIDHIDGDRANNRISNLRVVDCALSSRSRGMISTNKSGTTGVCAKPYTLASGEVAILWVASWEDLELGKRSRSFAERKYGNLAKEMAIAHRAAMIAKLNDQGAGYTQSHGTER